MNSVPITFKKLSEAEDIVGGLSKPSKMPGYAYGIPASECKRGSVLVNVPGSVCSNCYALKGRYVFPNVQTAQQRRFDSIGRPEWVAGMVHLIRTRKMGFFRWHDSGDIQDEEHLRKIIQVAQACPDTSFWLPTREEKLIRSISGAIPPNLVIRVSGAMIDGPPPSGFKNTSTVTTGAYTCPAPDQGNECRDCRACWDSGVANVAYKRH